VQEDNSYDSLNLLQKRLHDFAEAHNIKLLRETFPSWEDRLEIIKSEIEIQYVKHANWSDS